MYLFIFVVFLKLYSYKTKIPLLLKNVLQIENFLLESSNFNDFSLDTFLAQFFLNLLFCVLFIL